MNRSAPYDCIFLGSGIISILEAIYQSQQGKRVLMVDRGPVIGGVWTPIELFGLTNVENAVHYFLPNPAAFAFMRKKLGWTIGNTPGKFRIFRRKWLGIESMHYDRRLGRCIAALEEKMRTGVNLPHLLSTVKEAIQSAFFVRRPPSTYIDGGTPEIFSKVERWLKHSSVEVRLSTEVTGIFVDFDAQEVRLSTSGETFVAKTLVITHGSRLREIQSSRGPHSIVEQHHPRPAVHLLVEDDTPAKTLEAIFVADPLLKYAHDITRFTNEATRLQGRKKLFVLALQMEHSESKEIIEESFAKLMDRGVIGKNSRLLESKWWDIHLPTLDDTILEGIEGKFRPYIRTMKTEDFTAGIAYRAAEWENGLKVDFQ